MRLNITTCSAQILLKIDIRFNFGRTRGFHALRGLDSHSPRAALSPNRNWLLSLITCVDDGDY